MKILYWLRSIVLDFASYMTLMPEPYPYKL